MEDAVTRTHAQQLIAAALYVGSRLVGATLRRLLAHPNRIELRADGLAHTPDNAMRLQSLAERASKRALGEPPAAVVAAPDRRGGWRVHLAFADEHPPLQPHELADLQHTWESLKQREFGRDNHRPKLPEVKAREADADRAFDTLRRAQARLFAAPSTETRDEFRAAVNRAQVANDNLRTTLRRHDPVSFERPLYHDKLQFLVKPNGAEHLTLVERDKAVRDLLARAAALPDPSELHVSLRPTLDRSTWRAHVAFNFRNTPERQTQHINPQSLQQAILAQTPSVPAVAVQTGAVVAQVTLAAIEAVRQPTRAATERAIRLDPPTPMRSPEVPAYTHV